MTNKPSAPRELYATYYKSRLGESLVRTNTEPTLIKMNPDTDFEIKFVEASAYLAALEKCKALEGENKMIFARMEWTVQDHSKQSVELADLKAEVEMLRGYVTEQSARIDWMSKTTVGEEIAKNQTLRDQGAVWSNRCLKLLEALEYVKSHQSLLDQNDFDINNYADKAITEFKKDIGVKE